MGVMTDFPDKKENPRVKCPAFALRNTSPAAACTNTSASKVGVKTTSNVTLCSQAQGRGITGTSDIGHGAFPIGLDFGELLYTLVCKT